MRHKSYESVVGEDLATLREELPDDATDEEKMAAVLEYGAEFVEESDFALVIVGESTDTGGAVEAGEMRSLVIVNPTKMVTTDQQADSLLMSAVAVACRHWGLFGTLRRVFRGWRWTRDV